MILIQDKSNNYNSSEEKYRAYIENHIACVQKAFELFGEVIIFEIVTHRNNNLINIILLRKNLKTRIPNHDKSKYSREEFIPYCNKFFTTPKDPSEIEIIEKDFNKAWIHHYTNNDHYPEFWCYIMNGEYYKIPMKDDAFAEMIIDWIAMSIAKDSSTLEWWLNDGRKDKEKYLDSSDIEFLDYLIKKI